MVPEPNDLTWQSLYEYIQRRIAGTLNSLQLIEKDVHAGQLAEIKVSLERELEMLRWCLPLVREMQNKEDMQVVCPIMSLDLIRLRCRQQHDNQDRPPFFAWISPIANERYRLARVKVNKLQEPEKLWSFEGDLTEIVEKVENLVKEVYTAEDH
jgi:hypothetical protein